MELPIYERKDRVPLPPKGAKVHTTGCAYCAVGCGYKVYTWPIESGRRQSAEQSNDNKQSAEQSNDGGPAAKDNAFGVDFPTGLEEVWVSPNQSNIVMVGGKPHHCVIIPDPDATAVNPGGNHSIRGGTLALKCYTATGPTKDRLLFPQVRVNGKLVRVGWDTAIEVMAAVSKHVLAKYGEAAWGMKTYSYEFFENTYAITKLAFESVKTPAFSVHDKPSMSNDTAGVDDAGIITFSAAYEDFKAANVLFISGTDPYESKTVVFTEWMMRSKAKMIFVVPRRTMGVAYAESKGGLFLQIVPGTDALLHMALSRLILENGWEDQEFIQNWVANAWEIDSGFGRGSRNTPWQWRTTWGDIGAVDFAAYKKWLLAYEPASLDFAAKETGIPKAKIIEAAKLLTQERQERRTSVRRDEKQEPQEPRSTHVDHSRVTFLFEKGNYWSNNYLNTASMASLALICGSGNRPGRMVSRLGGHQRGWMGAAPYPREKSPERLPGRRKLELDLDRWVEKGEVRFLWVIGTTWTGAMTASQELASTVKKLTVESKHQPTTDRKDDIIAAFIRRVDAGGMVLVDSDLYPVNPLNTDLADIVLPAAAWGEHDGTRCNGERRLRLFSKFYDAPGEAKPDWWAVAQFARAMGFKGYDWNDDNAVFEEAARFSRGDVLDYFPLVWKAIRDGKKGHEALREMGTTGIQCPVRYEDGKLVGTTRLHDTTLKLGDPEGPTTHAKWLTAFNTHSGKALLIKSPWELFAEFYERIKPDSKKGELWLTTGRINEFWQSGFDDLRKPYLASRWPTNFVEIHPDDAQLHKIESGDVVKLTNDDVLIQTSGFNRVEGNEIQFAWLVKQGHVRVGKGEVEAVAMVTPAVARGLLFGYFLLPPNPFNPLAHRVADPITNNYRYKLAKAKVTRLGESPYKKDRRFLTYQRRDFT